MWIWWLKKLSSVALLLGMWMWFEIFYSQLLYYLEDDTLSLLEPRRHNSGLDQVGLIESRLITFCLLKLVEVDWDSWFFPVWPQPTLIFCVCFKLDLVICSSGTGVKEWSDQGSWLRFSRLNSVWSFSPIFCREFCWRDTECRRTICSKEPTGSTGTGLTLTLGQSSRFTGERCFSFNF